MAQRRSFRGVLLGYVDGMPAYRVWDIEAKKIRSVSYNFTISHEGYYPFRDKNMWPPECLEDPSNFSPVVDGVLSTIEWKKFAFDKEETEEIFQVAPGLVMDLPELPPVPKPIVDSSPPPPPLAPAVVPTPIEPTGRLQAFWRDAMEKHGQVDEKTEAKPTAHFLKDITLDHGLRPPPLADVSSQKPIEKKDVGNQSSMPLSTILQKKRQKKIFF